MPESDTLIPHFDVLEGVLFMAGKRIVKRAQVTITTFDHLWEEFIAEKKTLKKSDATIISYQGNYDRFHGFLQQEGYSMNADDVTAKTMQDFTNHLTDNEDETISEASVSKKNVHITWRNNVTNYCCLLKY